MNYLPFCGYWFYGTSNATKRASFYCSWGLLEEAPESGAVSYFSNFIGTAVNMFRSALINASHIGYGLISRFINPSDKNIH